MPNHGAIVASCSAVKIARVRRHQEQARRRRENDLPVTRARREMVKVEPYDKEKYRERLRKDFRDIGIVGSIAIVVILAVFFIAKTWVKDR